MIQQPRDERSLGVGGCGEGEGEGERREGRGGREGKGRGGEGMGREGEGKGKGRMGYMIFVCEDMSMRRERVRGMTEHSLLVSTLKENTITYA